MTWSLTQAPQIHQEHLRYVDTLPTTIQALEPASYQAQELDRRYHAYRQDIQHQRRLKQQQCRFCYYIDSGLAGQGFTAYTCQCCQQTSQWHNTHVPLLCNLCANTHTLCQHCSGIMD